MSTGPLTSTEIDAYIAASGISATRFGVLVAGDTKLVKTVRDGRKLRDGTAKRIREWMRQNPVGKK